VSKFQHEYTVYNHTNKQLELCSFGLTNGCKSRTLGRKSYWPAGGKFERFEINFRIKCVFKTLQIA
jgi:hypothetical protein